MLTIENINKILHKTLGKKNFYVARVEQQFSMDNTNLLAVEHKYKIEITNRKYAINVFLDRMPVINEQNYYRLYTNVGIPIYLTIGEIKNIDKFLDKIRLVGLN